MTVSPTSLIAPAVRLADASALKPRALPTTLSAKSQTSARVSDDALKTEVAMSAGCSEDGGMKAEGRTPNGPPI